MTPAGPIHVSLVGGPMDGDSFSMHPMGSVGYPQQLSYLASTGKEAGWLTYETENAFHGSWPEENNELHLRYHYIGTYNLGKGKVLQAPLEKRKTS